MKNNKEIVDEFLNIFKQLENKVVTICELEDDFISYSKAINHIHAKNLDPIIFNDNNFIILKQAGDLRNMLSHNQDVCFPTSSFFYTFKKIALKIIDTQDIYSICNKKIIYVTKDFKMKVVFDLFVKNHLSHLPILDENKIIKGIISRNSIFDYIYLNNLEGIDLKRLCVKDFYQVSDIESHLNESYLFVSKNDNIRETYVKLINKSEHSKTVSMLLITQNGLKNEKLLGVLTIADFNKVYGKKV